MQPKSSPNFPYLGYPSFTGTEDSSDLRNPQFFFSVENQTFLGFYPLLVPPSFYFSLLFQRGLPCNIQVISNTTQDSLAHFYKQNKLIASASKKKKWRKSEEMVKQKQKQKQQQHQQQTSKIPTTLHRQTQMPKTLITITRRRRRTRRTQRGQAGSSPPSVLRCRVPSSTTSRPRNSPPGCASFSIFASSHHISTCSSYPCAILGLSMFEWIEASVVCFRVFRKIGQIWCY